MRLLKSALFLVVIIAIAETFSSSMLCFAGENSVKIHFINVGQGEATLIQYKDKNILIDTGSVLSGYKLVDYLKKNGIHKIDHLIITHRHYDHIMGVFFIMPKFSVGKTYDNGYGLDCAGDSILSSYQKAFRSRGNYQPLKEGDKIKLEGLNLTVIWPPDRPSSGDPNFDSLVILLHYGNFGCLLTGDINKRAEAELLEKKIDLRADVLKIAHHGADDATCEDFLKKVGPKIAVTSADNGFQNKYPAEKTLELLKAANLKTFRTDKDGSVIITAKDEGTYTVHLDKYGLLLE